MQNCSQSAMEHREGIQDVREGLAKEVSLELGFEEEAFIR